MCAEIQQYLLMSELIHGSHKMRFSTGAELVFHLLKNELKGADLEIRYIKMCRKLPSAILYMSDLIHAAAQQRCYPQITALHGELAGQHRKNCLVKLSKQMILFNSGYAALAGLIHPTGVA